MLKTAYVPWTPMKIILEPYYFDFFGQCVKIPAGYAFDGLSIPRELQWLVNMNETQNQEAGLEHDFLYSKLSEKISSKIDSDYHLRYRVKCSKFRATIIFLWVDYFWKSSYRTDSNYIKYEKEIKNLRKKLWITKN